MIYDVFNGDADGICALIQLRLQTPLSSCLVTGVKRDIQLLDQLSVNAGDQLTVLDISLQKNQSQVKSFLAQGAYIFYVDHHQSGDIPNHPHLEALIDTDANLCTSLLVNRYLQNKYILWAIVGALGDNLRIAAKQLAATLAIGDDKFQLLENLGICINYNSYGTYRSDLHFDPEQLYRKMSIYISPFDFINENSLIVNQLAQGYQEDCQKAKDIIPVLVTDFVNVFILPDTAWSRRVSGVFANYLVNTYSDKANAVLLPNENGSYQVSVRAPLNRKIGADIFCSGFTSGGGRQAAAGINCLPNTDVDRFIQQFEQFYSNIRHQ